MSAMLAARGLGPARSRPPSSTPRARVRRRCAQRPAAFEHARHPRRAGRARRCATRRRAGARAGAGIAVDVGPGLVHRRARRAGHRARPRPAAGRARRRRHLVRGPARGLARPSARWSCRSCPPGGTLLYAGFYRADPHGRSRCCAGRPSATSPRSRPPWATALSLRARERPAAVRRARRGARARGARGALARLDRRGGRGRRRRGPGGRGRGPVGARLLAPPGAGRPAPDAGADGAPRPLYVRVPAGRRALPAERPVVAGPRRLGPFTEADLRRGAGHRAGRLQRPLAAAVLPRGAAAMRAGARWPSAAWYARRIPAGVASRPTSGTSATWPWRRPYQRRGVGAASCSRRWCARPMPRATSAITLEVRPSNFAAQELYRRFGFRGRGAAPRLLSGHGRGRADHDARSPGAGA